MSQPGVVRPVVLALAMLYLTIWPHELAHALAAYLCGCKSDWWRTGTSWFLWDSWGGTIDYGCLRQKPGPCLGLTDFAGIGVNLVLLGLAPVLGRWWRADVQAASARGWVFVATVFWALANYAEAFSYLILNTLWLESDMRTVVLESGVSRWLWLLVGMLGGAVLGRGLWSPIRRAATLLESSALSARGWRCVFIGYVAIISLAMAAARVTLKDPYRIGGHRRSIEIVDLETHVTRHRQHAELRAEGSREGVDGERNAHVPDRSREPAGNELTPIHDVHDVEGFDLKAAWEAQAAHAQEGQMAPLNGAQHAEGLDDLYGG